MTSVTPPAPPPPPLPPAQPALVTVQNPPAALLKLMIGAELLATVTQGPKGGALELESPLGRFSIQPVPSVPKAAVVTLILRTLQPQPQFVITAINGKPVPGKMPPSAAPPKAALAAGGARSGLVQAHGAQNLSTGQKNLLGAGRATPTPATGPILRTPSVHLVVGHQLSATALPRSFSTTQLGSTPRPALALALGQSHAPSGTINKALPAGVRDGTPTLMRSKPALNVLRSVSLATPQLSSPGGPRLNTHTVRTINQINTTPPPTSTGDFTPGARLQVQVLQVGANMATPSPSTGRAPRVSLIGTVTGRTPGGNVVVQTDRGYLALDTRAEIPEGTRVTIDVRQVRQPLRPLTMTPPPPAPTATPGPWTNLEDAVIALRDVSPMLAEQLARTALPRPGGGLAATFLLILSAVRTGNLTSLIGGPSLRTLERIAPDLAKRLGDDFQQMTGTVSDPATGDWRYAMLPVNMGTTIQRIRLLMKQRNQKKSKDKKDPAGTRFILDFELNALGRIQFDGLSKEDQHRLDLIIRTKTPLPQPLRTGINTIFSTTLGNYGLSGQLAYQGKAKFVDIDGAVTTIDGLATGNLSQLLV